jgi:hypothetical protein
MPGKEPDEFLTGVSTSADNSDFGVMHCLKMGKEAPEGNGIA